MSPLERWSRLGGLAVAQVCSWGILYYAFSVLLQPMERELGWSRTALSAAFSLGLLVSGLAAPAVGRLIDRGHARPVMTAGSVLGVVLLLAWSRVESPAAFLAIWLGLGIAAAGTLYDPAFAVVARWFDHDRGRALTALTLLGGLASTVFLPAASALVERHGWRAALVELAVVLAGVTVPLHVAVLRPPQRQPPSSVRPGLPPGEALRTPAFRVLSVAFLLGGLASGALALHLVTLFLERGLAPAASAGLVGLLGAMQLPGRLLFGALGGRLPPRASAALVFLAQAVAIALLLVLPGTSGGLAFAALYGMANGLMTLLRATLVADVFGTAHFGSISGCLAAAATGARAGGPLLAAAVHHATGGYGALLVGLAAGFVVAAAAVASLSGPGARDWSPALRPSG